MEPFGNLNHYFGIARVLVYPKAEHCLSPDLYQYFGQFGIPFVYHKLKAHSIMPRQPKISTDPLRQSNRSSVYHLDITL